MGAAHAVLLSFPVRTLALQKLRSEYDTPRVRDFEFVLQEPFTPDRVRWRKLPSAVGAVSAPPGSRGRSVPSCSGLTLR